MTLLTRHKNKDSPYFQPKIIILIALRGVKFPEGGAAAPVAPPGYALDSKHFGLIQIVEEFFAKKWRAKANSEGGTEGKMLLFRRSLTHTTRGKMLLFRRSLTHTTQGKMLLLRRSLTHTTQGKMLLLDAH